MLCALDQLLAHLTHHPLLSARSSKAFTWSNLPTAHFLQPALCLVSTYSAFRFQLPGGSFWMLKSLHDLGPCPVSSEPFSSLNTLSSHLLEHVPLS